MPDKFFNSIKEAADKHAEALFGDRSYPDVAFLVEHGAEKDKSGKTLSKYRHLPHHNKNAKSADENSSVDLPHLRAALARANQVKPVVEDKADFQKRAMVHLQKHAKILLKSYQKSSAEFKEIETICKEFNITLDEADAAGANTKVVKNGPTEKP
jgi:hypothetical protein